MESYKSFNGGEMKNASSSVSYNQNMIKSFGKDSGGAQIASQINDGANNPIGGKIQGVKNGLEGVQDISNNIKNGNEEVLNKENLDKVADAAGEVVPGYGKAIKVANELDNKLLGGKAKELIAKNGNKQIKKTKTKIKIMLVVSIASSFFLLAIFMCVFAEPDEVNMGLTNSEEDTETVSDEDAETVSEEDNETVETTDEEQ